MTEEEITKNNALIAEFIGMLPEKASETIDENINEEEDWIRYDLKPLIELDIVQDYVLETGWVHEKDLFFDTRWDWLMPVIEKISNTPYDDDDDEETARGFDYAFPRTFGMRDEEGYYLFRFNRQPLFAEETLLKAAYSAVVDFIKSYNNDSRRTTDSC